MSIDNCRAPLSYHAEDVCVVSHNAFPPHHHPFPQTPNSLLGRLAGRDGNLDACKCNVPAQKPLGYLCDELNDTASLLDLALGVLAEVAGADNERDGWETTLSEDLAVSEGEEVENWGGARGLAGLVLLTLLGWDERPEL